MRAIKQLQIIEQNKISNIGQIIVSMTLKQIKTSNIRPTLITKHRTFLSELVILPSITRLLIINTNSGL